ncbi:hypothetical protein BU24DRAFT_361636, partial [Aaosphaeria arxii CBS 175.79]
MGLEAERKGSSFTRLPMKQLSLALLTLQNSALILVMHYSRIMPPVNGLRYHTSTSVFLNELLKTGVSLTMVLYDISKNVPPSTTVTTLFRKLFEAVFTNDSWKLAIPAVLYTFQNTLQYVAVSNLDAATFQVTYQLKILTTALFSVLLLGRTLSPRRWASLLLLVVGVSIIQFPHTSSSSHGHFARSLEPESVSAPGVPAQLRHMGTRALKQLINRSASYQGIEEDEAFLALQHPPLDRSIGMAAVLVACVLSGLAGVSFEKVLKESTTSGASLWIRNAQLSFWSLFPSLFIGVIFLDGENIAKDGFFAGYNWVVWSAIGLQGCGGIVVAMVINDADNIAKNFATSISIILSCIGSMFFFDFSVTKSYLLGTTIVLLATYVYSIADQVQAKPTRTGKFERLNLEKIVEENEKDRILSPASVSSYLSRRSSSRPTTPNPTVGRHWSRTEETSPSSKRIERSQPRQSFLGSQTTSISHNPPQRNRYRTSHQFDDINEVDEQHEQGIVFDRFDQYLLKCVNEDRVSQAVRGEARLSFAPSTSKSLPHHLTSQSSMRGESYQGENYDYYDYHDDLAQAFFGVTQAGEPSSDGRPTESSSPAFRASQRRTGARQELAQSITHEETFTPVASEMSQPSNSRPKGDFVHKSPETQHMNISKDIVGHQRPVCSGIRLVPVSELPDRLKSIFSFPVFNAVQSRSFNSVYNSDDNFVLASPTGSGKTVILELAICRAFVRNATGQYKIVYQAPIKALCSERQRDWQKKFEPLGLTVIELTGDSDNAHVQSVQKADIIVTTPEKWDSITRKWKDHEKLMRLIRLFLIDEVHILKDERGAILEAVVSRMKAIGTDVRFVALSATVPNIEDVASWLGKNAAAPHKAAMMENFGEEFRPVKLQKYVCGFPTSGNDFQFDNFLDKKLVELIPKYSERKPIMIFCFTRASAVSTAKMLANWYSSFPDATTCWKATRSAVLVRDKDLQQCATSAVAFHHGGLELDDRAAVEQGYLKGSINVICCTSTLAVGVNLPCHLVIIKNTVKFVGGAGIQEYSDLEVMQMLGRAGRIQFDNSAVAVIMTRQSKVPHYDKMVSGKELLESNLHLGLIDHLNAEIGLGTITDLNTARKWLSGTFFYVRLKRNAEHYKLQSPKGGTSVDGQLERICQRDLEFLEQENLITTDNGIKATEFGLAMIRYYVRFRTMKLFLGLQPKALLSEIVSALSQADEFKEIRFRSGEKSFYKKLNQSSQMRFPVPVALTTTAHKVSLILQSVLGGADMTWDKDTSKHRNQYNLEANTVFKHATRLVRCIIDCQLELRDAVAAGHALMLERSLCARAWDDSPMHMKQIPDIGNVSVRKLINAGIKSVEELEMTDTQRLETVLGRNPPFGLKLLEKLKPFPKLRVSVTIPSSAIKKTDQGPEVLLQVALGFLNDQPPLKWLNSPVYVCLVSHSGSQLGKGKTLPVNAVVESAEQYLNCVVMCTEIAGTARQVSVKPKVPPHMFAARQPNPLLAQRPPVNAGRRGVGGDSRSDEPSNRIVEIDDDGIDDEELLQASYGDLNFDHIDDFPDVADTITRTNTAKNARLGVDSASAVPSQDIEGPKQLENGRWSCNHSCKDKSACKHLCCREGLDKPPKKSAKKQPPIATTSQSDGKRKPTGNNVHQSTLSSVQSAKKRDFHAIDTVDLTEPSKRNNHGAGIQGLREVQNLQQLHRRAQIADPPASISSVTRKKPAHCFGEGGQVHLSFLATDSTEDQDNPPSSDYGCIPSETAELCYEDFENVSDKEYSGCMEQVGPEYRPHEDFTLEGPAGIELNDNQNPKPEG